MKIVSLTKSFNFWLLLVVMSALFATSVYLLTEPDARYFQQRADAMNRCVEFKIYSDFTAGQVSPPQYELRFEDEFFCPNRSYTVLEALQRAESVFNVKRKPLNIVLTDTSEGIVLESMAGKVNSADKRWRVAVGGNQESREPLDRIVLQGKSFINFYYR